MLAVRILGCSGSYAAAGGACTGYLVQSSTATVWLDAGPGTFSNFQSWTTLGGLDAIVLTHAHPDHWLELPVVANALEWYEPRDLVPVYSNAHMYAEARNMIGDALSHVFDWHVVTPDSVVDIADQTWRFAETEHYVPTLAVRIDADEASLVFTSDTGPSFSLSALQVAGRPLDMVLCESTFLHRVGNEGILHLSAGEAAALAANGGARRLLLTHQSPLEDREAHRALATSRFDGDVALAEVGGLYPASG